MDSRARFQNSRIRAMLEKCNDRPQSNVDKNKENQPPPPHQFQSSTEVCNEKSLCSIANTLKYSTPEKLVNSINAVEYSMTLPVFRTFDERITSYNYGLNFTEIIATISADSLMNERPINTGEMALTCNETMLPPSCSVTENSNSPFELNNIHDDQLSPIQFINSPTGDFSSDDSVKDKNYCPSESSLDDEDQPTNQRFRHKPRINLNEPQQEINTIQPEISTRNQVANDAPAIITAAVIDSINENRISTREKKLKQKQDKLLSYNVKPGCDEKCMKKCSSKLTSDARKEINKSYWALSWKERRIFIQNSTAVAIPKRKITSEPKRAPKSRFSLKNVDGTGVDVCKMFFLTTLGFHRNNDTVLYNSLKKNTIDKRGLHTKTPMFDRRLLTDHVESFHPLEPHYRREHAPLRRYLSCDVTVTLMHKDFCEKYPSQKVSYELYRKHLKSMNISFAKLGNEECEVCEAYELHSKNTSHDAKNSVPENCETCVSYLCHREKYKKARELYECHKKNEQTSESIYFSVDLQKVIMLPRLDSFKSIIFCHRLTSFNLSFAPLGKITNQHKPLACVWHDGTSGRRQEDIMIFCFYNFFMHYRDVKHITLWMDNCSAQNKNWLLFSLMIFLINSDQIATETITFQYFEPGHTFMSCDQFHHQVELAMKRKGKLYDFKDLTDCVASANKSRVDVKTMEPNDFFSFQNYVSDRRIQSSIPRVYLKDIIQVCFQRNNFDLLYKNAVNDEDYKVLRFMTDKYLKNTDILKPLFKSAPKGIDRERKDGIVNALKDITAPHKMRFWYEMPESS